MIDFGVNGKFNRKEERKLKRRRLSGMSVQAAITDAVRRYNFHTLRLLCRDHYEESPYGAVMIAIERNDEPYVRLLLGRDAYLSRDHLRRAVNNGNIPIVDILLNHPKMTVDADVLQAVCGHARVDIVEFILNHPRVNHLPHAGSAVFKKALTVSNVELVQYLLENHDRYRINVDFEVENLRTSLSSEILDVLEKYRRWSKLRSAWIGAMIRAPKPGDVKIKL